MTHYVGILFTSLLMCLGVSSQGNVRTRCYEDPPIGCFSNEYPYDNTIHRPSSIEKINLHYVHYNGTESRMLHWREAAEAVKSRFQPDLRTTVLVHGWFESSNERWLSDLVQELIRKEPMNLFIVDWRGGARVFDYLLSIANGRVVASMVAMFFKDLQALGADVSTFHLIGNSLGAHVCGHIGANLPGIGRITAVDPSGRAMEESPPEARLDPTDAMVVDVIHTDGSKTHGFGTIEPMGTVDFYVNGGKNQPGCIRALTVILFEAVIQGLGFNKCSHARAKTLFTKSVNECALMASPCQSLRDALDMNCQRCVDGDTCVEFGYDLTPNATGMYSIILPSERMC